MAKDKKGNYSNQNPNKNKNLKKDTKHPPRGGNDQFNNKKGHPQRGNNSNKRPATSNLNEMELPPIKNKPPAPSQQTQPQSQSLSSSVQKKVLTAKPEQVQEVLSHLEKLETLLNSYDELEMDENKNLKNLVDSILQKSTKSE